MKRTIHYHDRNQGSLAEEFAAPDLYKADPFYGPKPLDWGNTSDEVIDQLLKRANAGNRAVVNGCSLMGLDSVPLCNDQPSPDCHYYVQKAVFYADKIVVYPEFLPHHESQIPQRGKIENLTRGQFNGYISRSASIKIRKRLEAWIKAVYVNAEFQNGPTKPKHAHIGFLTLTLPSDQVHSDNEIGRRCLTPFIQQLKRIYGVESYFWCAQPQENGNIHFHLLIDRWVDKDGVNDYWNVATDHLGYLSRSIASGGSHRPPSTNIKSCPKDMSLVKYVMKYVSRQPEIRLSCYPADHVRADSGTVRSEWKYCKSRTGEGGEIVSRSEAKPRKVVSASYWAKSELTGGMSEAIEKGYQVLSDQIEVIGTKVYRNYEHRPIQGRCWGMSDSIRNISVPTSYVSYRVRDLISILNWDPTVRITSGDYHEVYHCNVYDKLLRLDPVLLADYRRHYVQLYQSIYYPTPPDPLTLPPQPPPEPDICFSDNPFTYSQLTLDLRSSFSGMAV